MTLNVNIPPELAERIEAMTGAADGAPERFALAAIERALAAWERADQALAPVREAFEASGMTEDEANELFEAEKQAYRREQRASGSP